MSWGHILFGFSGRINRAKYWLASLFWAVILLVVLGVFIFIVIRDASNLTTEEMTNKILSYGLGIAIVFVLVFIPAFVSGLAIGIKRLHDRNKSGWWILLFYFVPSVMNAVGSQLDIPAVSIIVSLAAFAIAIWGFVELACLRGTVGPNRYGPDPLENKL
jgi:uncharacterized membrane protein YhaH (DUF805 family)